MKILVTAGPTREPIDPVRFISNRSSGKMGYALARAAAARAHEVILVSGPVSLPALAGVRTVRIETAAQMLEAVERHFDWCEALIMAAAVADWRPAVQAPAKLKKRRMKMTLALEPTVDILERVAARKGKRLLVGFAAETGNLVAEARRKLLRKRLDLVVANEVGRPGSGFDADTNAATILAADGSLIELPLMSKDKMAGRLVRLLEKLATAGSRKRR